MNDCRRPRPRIAAVFSAALVAIVLLFAGGCRSSRSEPVHLFAAASTRAALEELAAQFRAETGIAVELNTAATSELATQIIHGAPADLLLSADEKWGDELARHQLVEERRDLLSNELVVVPAASNLKIHVLADLAQPAVKRLGVAGAAVPAGRYAREALTKAGVWDQVADRVVEGANVEVVLTYVDRQEVDAGLVYASDAKGNPKVRVAFQVESRLHTPIRYPLILVRRDAIKPEARRFFEFLGSAPAEAVFRRFGFGTLAAESKQ